MPTASYPNFAGKHAGQALFTAADFLAYLRQVGALDDEAAPGGAVLCYQRSLYDHVLRAEGLARLATAQAEMTAALGTALRESGLAFRPGVSWTIDAPYRETVAEARHYQAEGVLCVEMEAAALFAVAEVRGLRLAAAFVISDSLADLVWSCLLYTSPSPRD